MKILVTGCDGFIASHFISYVKQMDSIAGEEIEVIGLSRTSNNIHESRLKENIKVFSIDLCNDISEILEEVDIVINFAARTFVDSSIKNPKSFIDSNIYGVFNLLEQSRKYGVSLFVQVSTDEVYGSSEGKKKKEEDRLNPMNPYSASKAAAEMLVMSYSNTYKIPYLITRAENTYGTCQHPQKIIPKFIKYALADKRLPLYGDGLHKRMWLHVEDHCSAIWHLIANHHRGIFNIGSEEEMTNLELTKFILKELNKSENLIRLTDDSVIRPGHDTSYGIDCSKLRKSGWSPEFNIKESLPSIIQWYKENSLWLN